MLRQLGPLASTLLAERHAATGVRLIGDARVQALTGDGGRTTGALLADGRELGARLVIVAIGSTPAVEWLDGTGLDVSDGVLCDATCRADAGIWAVGDVARWFHAGVGRRIRLENRSNATEQAAAVARNVLGADTPYTPVPYAWTDQHGVRIQTYGFPGDGTETEVVEGSVGSGRFVAVARRAGSPVGVVGWGMPKQARLHSSALAGLFAPSPRPVG